MDIHTIGCHQVLHSNNINSIKNTPNCIIFFLHFICGNLLDRFMDRVRVGSVGNADDGIRNNPNYRSHTDDPG